MKVTGPLFKWFGSKWLSSKTLPPPKHSVIEPFAGGAGYSLRHAAWKSALIAESNPLVFRLWQWLVRDASWSAIREIPLGVKEGTDIRTLGLCPGQELLLKHWQRTNNVGNCWTISPWGNKPGQWTANTRARVAEEFHAVRQWQVLSSAWSCLDTYHEFQRTWFIDPPYQFNYQYGNNAIDYRKLAARVGTLQGQIIVCEAVCPKTQNVPEWLPFRHFGKRITSRRKAENNHHSKELIYTAQR